MLGKFSFPRGEDLRLNVPHIPQLVHLSWTIAIKETAASTRHRQKRTLGGFMSILSEECAEA